MPRMKEAIKEFTLSYNSELCSGPLELSGYLSIKCSREDVQVEEKNNNKGKVRNVYVFIGLLQKQH